MTGHLENLQAYARKVHHVSLAHQTVGGRAGDGQAERGTEVGLGIREEMGLVDANEERRVRKGGLESAIAADVVGVAVRVEDGRGQELTVLQEVQDQLGFQARVDNQNVCSAGKPNHV